MAWYDVVDATKKQRLGTKKRAMNGNEYIYLQGVASVVDGTWVTFDEDFVTARAVADAQGQVAIATAAVDATTEYGWFAIWGMKTGLCLASFVDNGVVYLTSTAGSVDDTDVAGDQVYGAIGRTARDTTTGMSEFQLNYPEVLDAGN